MDRNFIEVKNSLIPFSGYKAVSLFPFVFVRRRCVDSGRWSDTDRNHESIHIEQQKELLVIPFYLLYMIEYIFKLFRFQFNTGKAYRSISFEREAYENETNPEYRKTRKHFQQWRKKIQDQ